MHLNHTNLYMRSAVPGKQMRNKNTAFTTSPEIVEAALRVLATLRQRADKSRTSGMLLRPSSAAPDAEKTLLRATHEPHDMHEEQLLRANEDNGSSVNV